MMISDHRRSSGGASVAGLEDYIAVVRRRKWVIVAVTVLAALLGGAYNFSQTPIYQATSKVLVLPVTSAPFSGQIRPDAVNVQTEQQLVTSLTVAQAAARQAGGGVNPLDLVHSISVSVPADSQIMTIAFTDPSPKRAAIVAQAFADAYLDFKRNQVQRTIQGLTRTLQSKIQSLEQQLRDATRTSLTAPSGSVERANALAQKQVLSGQIRGLQSQISTLSGVDVNPGQIVAQATVPRHPVSPKLPVNLALGIFLGLFTGTVLAFVRERTDDRVRTMADVVAASSVPVLATIPRGTRWQQRRRKEPVTIHDPAGPAAEGYRTLRTTLLAMAAQQGAKSVMIASPESGEGKSTTAANIAVLSAEAGRRVVLVSADLRKPHIHELFALPASPGLPQVLAREVASSSALHPSEVERLWVLTSGPSTPAQVELLGSPAMSKLLAELGDTFDLIVIDSSPTLPVADSLAMAPMVDAVLVVASAGRTTMTSLVEARRQITQVGARMVGAVLHGGERSRKEYGYGYSENGDKSRRGRVRRPSAPVAPGPRELRSEPRAGDPRDSPADSPEEPAPEVG